MLHLVGEAFQTGAYTMLQHDIAKGLYKLHTNGTTAMGSQRALRFHADQESGMYYD